MVLLREVTRRWSRNLRLFGTQILPYADPISLQRKGGRLIPNYVVQNADFLLNTWLSQNKPMEPADWVIARKDLMASTDFDVTESKVDMIIVHLCLSRQKIDKAMEYLTYIWETNGEMNVAAMGHYLKLCYVRQDREINEVEKKYLYQIYDTIKKKYPVLDSVMSENCIVGISKTERWRESIEVLEMIKLSDAPRVSSYTAIISAAFDNNDPEIGWKYLEEILPKFNPNHQVYTKYLEYCKRNFHETKLENEMGKMFEFWADNDVRPYIEVIDAYAKALEELGWAAVQTSITGNGVCKSCRHNLNNLQLKKEEYVTLANTIHDRVIVGRDVYERSNPQEYKKFLKFVNYNKPWDVVIDGLNIAYCGRGKPDVSVIYDAVKKFVVVGKKVLVLGRKHMAKHRSLNIEYIKRNAHIFLADDKSADDPFALYATFSSGPSTMLVSRDLMRQHVFCFENIELKRIFKYWQMSNQNFPFLTTSAAGKKEFQLGAQTKYLPIAQKHSSGWHVPFTHEFSLLLPDTFVPPKSWMCFTKKKTTETNTIKK